MYPILARYGPFFLYSYTVMLGIGIVLAVALTRGRPGGRSINWRDSLYYAVPAGIVGGRVAFVIVNWSYFAERPVERFAFGDGGLLYHGALVGVLATLLAWSTARRVSFFRLLDVMAPGVALLFVMGWLACYLEGCAYGRAAPLGLLTGDLPDTFGVRAVRYHTQLLGAALSALTLAFLWRWRRAGPVSGRLGVTTLLLLTLVRLVISPLRGDVVPLWFGQRADLVGDLVVLAASTIVLLVLWLRAGKPG